MSPSGYRLPARHTHSWSTPEKDSDTDQNPTAAPSRRESLAAT